MVGWSQLSRREASLLWVLRSLSTVQHSPFYSHPPTHRNFTEGAFSRAAIPPATFAVPAGCDQPCKPAAESWEERLAARVREARI